MVNMSQCMLQFDSGRNCHLRCSKKVLDELNFSSKRGLTSIKICQSGKEYVFGAIQSETSDDYILYLNRDFGRHLKLSEGPVKFASCISNRTIQSFSLTCSSEDFTIVDLHREFIENELINQISTVSEDMPVILFVAPSLLIKFIAKDLKPSNSTHISNFTKVELFTSDENMEQVQETKCLQFKQLLVNVSFGTHISDDSQCLLPELKMKCFCNLDQFQKFPSLLSPVSNSATKVFSYVTCCTQCTSIPSNTSAIGNHLLSYKFQPNELVQVNLWENQCQWENIKIQSQTLNIPLFGGTAEKYVLPVLFPSSDPCHIDINISKTGQLDHKVRKHSNKKTISYKVTNPHQIIVNSIVENIISNYPFSLKSLSLLTSNIQCHGAGKTFNLNSLITDDRLTNYFKLYKNLSPLRGKRIENIVKEITDYLVQCCLSQPAVLILDDIDAILPAHSKNDEPSGDEIFGTRLVQKLVHLISQYKNYSIEVVVSTQCVSTCHPLLLENCDNIFILPILNQVQQLNFLKSTLSTQIPFEKLKKSFVSLSLKSNLTVGEVYKVSEVLRNFEDSFENDKLTDICMIYGLKKKKPSNDLSLTDCGGLTKAKTEIEKMLILPSLHANLFSQIPFQINRGLLLYGVPGTGKTHVVRALANDLDMSFLSIKGPELLNKYIGASEEAVRSLFRKAEEMSPTLIFFDEFDSLAPCRGNDTTGVMDRVVNQLLTELDGISQRDNVYIIAATSRPDSIDPAILRPGRIGRKILCPMPNSSDRTEIWDCLLKNLNHNNSINSSELSVKTDNFSGADIRAAIYNAQLHIVKHSEDKTLTQNALLVGISETTPSLTEADLADYDLKYDMFVKGKVVVGIKTTQK